jgi:hypothetical protein
MTTSSDPHVPSKEHLCTRSVSDHTGFHFSPCGRPAKYAVKHKSHVAYRCGLHVRRERNRLTVVSVEKL